jgi:hypothetical protein
MFKFLLDWYKNWQYKRKNATFELFYEDNKYVNLELKNGKVYISEKDYNICYNNLKLLEVLDSFGDINIIK